MKRTTSTCLLFLRSSKMTSDSVKPVHNLNTLLIYILLVGKKLLVPLK